MLPTLFFILQNLNMKQITLFFFILLPFLGITQQDSSVFYTGRGNLKLSNGKFTITRPNGNLIANFPAYLLKPQFDSLLNHYNDTTDKSGISCVDSLWKVGNIVYHRNWNCDVQSFAIDPPTVDGCSGGYVYKKSVCRKAAIVNDLRTEVFLLFTFEF